MTAVEPRHYNVASGTKMPSLHPIFIVSIYSSCQYQWEKFTSLYPIIRYNHIEVRIISWSVGQHVTTLTKLGQQAKHMQWQTTAASKGIQHRKKNVDLHRLFFCSFFLTMKTVCSSSSSRGAIVFKGSQPWCQQAQECQCWCDSFHSRGHSFTGHSVEEVTSKGLCVS